MRYCKALKRARAVEMLLGIKSGIQNITLHAIQEMNHDWKFRTVKIHA
jgi:hypothetical protein